MWEWVLDWHQGNWYGDQGNTCTDRANLNPASARVVRGDDFYSDASYLRVANRGYNAPSYRNSSLGFRCARTR